MLFRFLILSDEADDFKREIKIDSESTFLDLQNAILDSVGYTKDQMTSFFICDDDWSKDRDHISGDGYLFRGRQLCHGRYSTGRIVGRRAPKTTFRFRLYDRTCLLHGTS